jgi:predicted O-methyltransferase YrrM
MVETPRMDRNAIRRRLAAGPAARLVTLPTRLGSVAQYNGRTLTAPARWLVRSREHTNYTYDLSPLNIVQLAWFVSDLAKRPIGDAIAAINEIAGDEDLVAHVLAAVQASPRRGTMDRSVRLGRRLGWYALVRLLTPAHVVETGTDKGLGTCVLAAAVLRNGVGRVTTIDINPNAGTLIAGPYASVVDRRVGDSVAALASLENIDLFVHDSDHSPEHELRELLAIAPRLGSSALVLSDNSHATDVLPRWAEQTGRRFAFFAEKPLGHWYPGAGIGASQPL